ncbi:hypothetical protein FEV09_19945 [Pseudanabaena catenata USMAC16]|uniref:Uncharacterized protein n=1 Tax=Pseudanabaena catenata USMAC16 TaxID=1855837 RepID=A0A9X4MCH1_9CYAN|nr:hypothetical protein [Pseudanabaena catenata]MDG3496817.1 hypothetical protein [Pseudanabaena catenata USMAC16]
MISLLDFDYLHHTLDANKRGLAPYISINISIKSDRGRSGFGKRHAPKPPLLRDLRQKNAI